MKGLAIILALVLSFASTAYSQQSKPGDPPKSVNGKPFKEFANSDAYFEQLARETMRYESSVGACEKPTGINRIRAGRPQIPTSFPKLGVPPQWMEVLRIEGCEKPVTRSVLVIYPSDKVIFLPLVNGKALSRFDVILQHDVIKTLMSVERVFAARAGCSDDKSIRILDTKTKSQNKSDDGLDWTEEWVLSNCKGEKRVDVQYSYRDGKGTNFSIKQVKAE